METKQEGKKKKRRKNVRLAVIHELTDFPDYRLFKEIQVSYELTLTKLKSLRLDELAPSQLDDPIVSLNYQQYQEQITRCQDIVKQHQEQLNSDDYYRYLRTDNYRAIIELYQETITQLEEVDQTASHAKLTLEERLKVISPDTEDLDALGLLLNDSERRFKKSLEILLNTFITLPLDDVTLSRYKSSLKRTIDDITTCLSNNELNINRKNIVKIQKQLQLHIGYKNPWLGSQLVDCTPERMNWHESDELLLELAPQVQLNPKKSQAKDYKRLIACLEKTQSELTLIQNQSWSKILIYEKSSLELKTDIASLQQSIDSAVVGLDNKAQALHGLYIDYSCTYYWQERLEYLKSKQAELAKLKKKKDTLIGVYLQIFQHNDEMIDELEKLSQKTEHLQIQKDSLARIDEQISSHASELIEGTAELEEHYYALLRQKNTSLKKALENAKGAQQVNPKVEFPLQEAAELIKRLEEACKKTCEEKPRLETLRQEISTLEHTINSNITQVKKKLYDGTDLLLNLINDEHLVAMPRANELLSNSQELIHQYRQLTLAANNSKLFDEDWPQCIALLSVINPHSPALNSAVTQLKTHYVSVREKLSNLGNTKGAQLSQWQQDTKHKLKEVERSRAHLCSTFNKAAKVEAKIRSDSFQTSLTIINSIEGEINRLLTKHLPLLQQRFVKNEQLSDLEQFMQTLNIDFVVSDIETYVNEHAPDILGDDFEANALNNDRAARHRLLDLIDPRLKILIKLKNEFNTRNTLFLQQDPYHISLEQQEQNYRTSLTQHVLTSLHNDNMETLSDEYRTQATQWIRKKVLKPLKELSQSIKFYFWPLAEDETKPCPITWRASKTEISMIELGNQSIDSLNKAAAAPAA